MQVRKQHLELDMEQQTGSKQEKEYVKAGRDWGQEEKGTTEDEMAGWHQ